MAAKIYKYRTGSAALRCLSEGSLYFAKAESLNDILEAKFDCVETYEFYREFLSGLNAVREKRNLPPYNCNFPSLPEEFFKVNTEENRRLIEASKGSGIFSGSIRPDNQALWAYYANDFKGVCFETEWSDEIIQARNLMIGPVIYSSSQRTINRAEDFRDLIIQVGCENKDWSEEKLIEFSQSYAFRRVWGKKSHLKAMSIKHTDWLHEQEIRIVSSMPGALPVLYNVLKRVFL